MTWEVRASELDDVLGPSELTALGDTGSLLQEPTCNFEGQLAEATGDPVGTAVLIFKDADQWLVWSISTVGPLHSSRPRS